MLKLVLLFFLISSQLHAQEIILSLVKDSDVVLINSSKLEEFKVKNISFIEQFDSLLFKNYPVSSNNIKFIKHICDYNSEGLANNYQWSFADSDILVEKESEKSSGSFFITNDYKFEYNTQLLKKTEISDASPITKVSYYYKNDSIYQDLNIYSSSSSSQIVRKSYHKNCNKIIYSHTGNKQHFFPVNQIICLGKINSNSILINNLPFMSFFDKKFDNNRFLIEIRPAMWILFEIVE